jgi:hypothetical protein
MAATTATTPTPPTIQQALSNVMRDVGAVRKEGRNQQQNFNFRGIDAVVNAVYPAFAEHGVICVPDVQSIEYANIEIGAKRTPMGHVRVTVSYTFFGPAGDSLTARVAAEAMDSGDKATAKAMSVALRTALLQTLCLPTDEPDPDSHTYERSHGGNVPRLPAKMPPVEELYAELTEAAAVMNTDMEALTAKFRRENGDLTPAEFLALKAEDIYEFTQQVKAYVKRQTANHKEQ